MRSIGQIDNEEQAQRFGDYLLASGIPCDIEEEEEGTWSIWVHDDDQIERAESELAHFNHKPEDSRYKEAKAKAENIRLEEAKADELAAKRQVDVRTQVFGSESTCQPYLTFFLIGMSLMVQALQLAEIDVNLLRMSTIDITPEAKSQMNQAQETSYRITKVLLPEVTGKTIPLGDGKIVSSKGQIWRIITPIFLHFGLLHIIFNMYWLYYLGGGLEGKLGLGRMFGFIIISAVISNLGQYLISGPGFGGMSGVNYALFGYIWIRGKNDPFFEMQLDQGTITMLLIWFAICFTGLVGNIANGAHTFGLIAGVAAGWLWRPKAPVTSSFSLVRWGYYCVGLSVLLPPLGLAGLIIGAINITKGEKGHGVAQIIGSIICALIGMAIGVVAIGLAASST